MLFARIGGFDFDVLSADITWRQNQISEFKVSLDYKEILKANVDPFLNDASILFVGQTIISGIIMDKAELKVSKKKVIATLHGYGEFGRLLTSMSRFGAHYQEMEIIAIIADLIYAAPTSDFPTSIDWEVGEITTMDDPLQVTTVDLRSKEVLWSQITETVKSIPGLFLRYGGVNADNGKHRIDIGSFGTLQDVSFDDSENILSIKRSKPTTREYIKVRSLGGLAGTVTVTLEHASLYDPALLTDPDFPISSTAYGWIVTNNAVTNGYSVAKQFTEYKTQNDTPPTAAERNQAGYGLYLRTVRFLQENAPIEVISLETTVSEVPKINDKYHVHAKVVEVAHDMLSEVSVPVDTFDINGDYRVTSATLKFDTFSTVDMTSEVKTENMLRFNVELTDGTYLQIFDDSAFLFERLLPSDESEDVVVTTTPPSVLFGSTSHDWTNPADAGCLPDLAKVFTIASPAPPPGAVDVQAACRFDTPLASILEITNAPAFPGDNWVGCIQYNGTWPPPSPISVTLFIYFIFLF